MSENVIIEIIVLFFVLAGTIITLFASLGVIRLPDVYTRAHATTKSSTLGILFILLGAFIHFMYSHQVVSVRLLLAIVFVFLTAPVAGHLIIRSAHRSGVPLADMSVQDALKDDLEAVQASLEAGKGSLDMEVGSLEAELNGKDGLKRGSAKEQDGSDAQTGGSRARADGSDSETGGSRARADGSDSKTGGSRARADGSDAQKLVSPGETR